MLISKAEIIIQSENTSFSEFAAKIILERMKDLGDRPSVISLSGGQTPLPIYSLIATNLCDSPVAENFHFIQTDERNVDSNSLRSNQSAILNRLFNSNGLALKQFSMIRQGNHDFENNFSSVLPGLASSLMPPRPIDIVILGMGSDGHTAGLFPDTDWQNSDSLTGYRTFLPKSQSEQRISLTIERIIQAEHIIFLVSGTDKKEALARVLIDKNRDLPTGYLVAEKPTTWIMSKESFEDWYTV